ncbi:MAG: DUF4363 family protein [Clostridia bacterium]|nr:DUF4363 family protein [Clostridia bacterium]
MISRFLSAIGVAVALVTFVSVSQICLSRTSKDLAEQADEVCSVLSEEGREEEGLRLLEALISDFEHRRPFLGIFVNDARIHEIQRALSRAQQLAGEGDVSPALEALTDLSKTLKELSETHRPTWENVL